MNKIILNLSNGKIEKINCPDPSLEEGFTYVKNLYSVVSPGTEKMLIKFGNENLFKKVIHNLDKVSIVVRKIFEEGFISTYKKVENKLKQPIELGYSTCSVVVDTTSNNFSVGDIVITNGPHSDFSLVKNNLCLKIDNLQIDKKNLSYSFIAAIAVNAFKISKVNKEHSAAVIGLGALGVILSKFIISEKIKLYSFDINNLKTEQFKNELNAKYVNKNFTNIDSNMSNSLEVVFLCIENISTKILYKSCEMLKKNGTVIIVGTTKAYFPRDIIYKKNLKIKVAVSYGPGRYDESFEKGLDSNYLKKYKFSYLDNLNAFIKKLDRNDIDLTNLNFKEYSFDDYKLAYKDLSIGKIQGIVFNYNKYKIDNFPDIKIVKELPINNNLINCDIIGTGNHSSNVIIPNIIKSKNRNVMNLISKNGISDYFINNKLKLNANLSSINQILQKKYINNYLFILSSHNTHSKYLLNFINLKKKIFIEKPLCENLNELEIIKKTLDVNYKKIHINYNRRYSDIANRVKKIVNQDFTTINYNIFSSSFIKENRDLNSIKSILIGEMCHFIDFAQYIIDKKIDKFEIYYENYNVFLKLFFVNKSIANINYYTIENNNLSKEYITIINGDNYIEIDNFKKVKMFFKNTSKLIKKRNVEKGFSESINFFFNDNINKNYYNQIIDNSKITIKAFEIIKNKYFDKSF